jgi:hypothetical protein
MVVMKSQLALALLMALIPVLPACGGAPKPGEYWESNDAVIKVEAELTGDDYLRVVTFLRLRDGSIQDPKIRYYQSHYTAIGVQRVEKPGRLSQVVTNDGKLLYLPTSDEIADYLFLVQKPIITKVEKDGVMKQVTNWTDWQLFEVRAKDVLQQDRVTLPAFEECAAKAADKKELLKKLRALYSAAHKAATIKMNTPIKSRSEVPWYAQ